MGGDSQCVDSKPFRLRCAHQELHLESGKRPERKVNIFFEENEISRLQVDRIVSSLLFFL